MARWAVFDVDGTLLPCSSMEKQFLYYLIKKRLLPFGNLLYFAVTAFVSAVVQRREEAVKSIKSYLRGLSVSDIDEYAEKFFQQYLSSALSRAGIQKTDAVRRERYKILIISGAPMFLTRCLESVYYPDYVVSTELEIVNGNYSGNILGLHPYGGRKREILENIQHQLDIDFGQSIVFANHHTDIPHMELFGHAVAVNPTHHLRNIAMQRDWEIAVWE